MKHLTILSRVIIQFIVGIVAVSALAASTDSASLTVDLETRLQEKLSALLKPIDPNSQVLVKIEVRTISTELPGANLEVSQLDALSNREAMRYDDIQSVDVKVLSELSAIPVQIKNLLQTAVRMGKAPVKISYTQFDSETRTTIQAAEQKFTSTFFKLAGDTIGSSSSNLTKFAIGFTIVAFIALFIGISLLLVLRLVRSTIQDGLVAIASAVSEGSVAERHSDSGHISAGAPVALANSFSSSGTEISEMPNDSLVALFSDCYWCEQDEYASWIWTQASTPQRTYLLATLPYATAYARYITEVAPARSFNSHRDPYYFNPLPLISASQKDVTAWLKQNPGGLRALSPMRKSHIQLPIRERVQLQTLSEKSEKFERPVIQSVTRLLTLKADEMRLSNQDDLIIFKTPEVIPYALRRSFPSLAWVHHLSSELKTELFKSLTASEVAQAWCGPQELLEKLQPFLAEKKMRLVLDIAQREQPSRESVSYKKIIGTAFDLLDQTNNLESIASHVKSKAA